MLLSTLFPTKMLTWFHMHLLFQYPENRGSREKTLKKNKYGLREIRRKITNSKISNDAGDFEKLNVTIRKKAQVVR